MEPTAVRQAAEELGLPVRTYLARERRHVTAALADLQLDVLLVVAFGHILKPPLLATARCGAVNVHASLLPRWRGSSPVEQAILAGDAFSGVTLMQLDEGVDTGPMLATRQVAIAADETRLSLLDKLAQEGAHLVRHELLRFLNGELQPLPQPPEGVRHAPRLEKRQGLLLWQADALTLERQVRAFHGWPGCFTFLNGETLKVHTAKAHATPTTETPGTVLPLQDDAVLVACGNNVLQLLEVQLPGKRLVTASDLWRSGRLGAGMHFEAEEMGRT